MWAKPQQKIIILMMFYQFFKIIYKVLSFSVIFQHIITFFTIFWIFPPPLRILAGGGRVGQGEANGGGAPGAPPPSYVLDLYLSA